MTDMNNCTTMTANNNNLFDFYILSLLLFNILTIVSSIGYVILSGKMQVDRQDTTFFILFSKLTSKTF